MHGHLVTAAPKAEPLHASGPESAASARSHRDLRTSLLVGFLCLVVYNANLRSISAGDTYPARYLPFGIWRYHTVLLDPIRTITAQGRANTAFWIVLGRRDHAISLYPVVGPVLLAPLYLPAVAYLDMRGWDQQRLERSAWIMEKLSASLLAAASAGLLYLLLRRRAGPPTAFLLTLAFAFGTETWVISSQALWQHGLAELLVVATLFLLTGPCTARGALAAGLLCGLIACNRPPDSILAAALGIYGLWWARRLAPLLVASATLPVALVLAYNLSVAGNFAGGYGLAGKAAFFQHGLLSGLAGLLFSPTRGLFVFSPFLLFLPWCLPQALRDRGTRGLTVAAGIAVLLQLLLYAKTDWRAGFSWGPRYLTDVLPLLLWMMPPIVSTLRTAGRVAFLSACVGAMAIQAVGAFWYTHTSDTAIFAASAGPNDMRSAWDLRNTPFIAELRHARAPAELAIGVRGSLDSMTSSDGEVGDVAAGKEIGVAGWALAGGHSPWDVIAVLDGQPVGSTTRFVARPDVTGTPGETSPSGWRIAIPAHAVTPGEHVLAVLVRASESGDPRFLTERRFTVLTPDGAAQQGPRDQTAQSVGRGESGDLAPIALRAAAALTSSQQAPGYWLTSYTDEARFQGPRLEMNAFVTSMMIDVLDPVSTAAGLGESLQRARRHLAGQIEATGLVRYHGRPDAPTIGTLGCAITPDADDTALVWRIAPGAHPELLPAALAVLDQYRTPAGLYRTWLAPRDRYQCINPGRDPNPTDVGIQMHVLMLLAQADPPAARVLCGALERAIAEDRIWVYYQIAPLVPILRQADLQKAGCTLRLPQSRLRTAVPGQEVWVAAGQLLERLLGAGGPAPAPAEVLELLRRLSKDDFLSLRQSPPLLYHNDLTASVPRFYWSEQLGYALWLRLYFENARQR